MMQVAITGSSGLIGTALTRSLRQDGHEVLRLVRRPAASDDEAWWDPTSGGIDSGALEGLDAVIHLAGENLSGGLWTKRRITRIRDSRLLGTALVARALAGLHQPPRVFLSSSAVGYYGDRAGEALHEGSGRGSGFLADLCQEWEAATLPAAQASIRVVTIRQGIVFGGGDRVLGRMRLPFSLGLGATLGDGRQWMGWIALEDSISAARFLLEDDSLQGPVNVVSPEPVTNAELTKTLAHVLGRPAVLRIPAFVLRLALGRMADEALLASARVEPRRLLEAGFQFACPGLEQALGHALGKP